MAGKEHILIDEEESEAYRHNLINSIDAILTHVQETSTESSFQAASYIRNTSRHPYELSEEFVSGIPDEEYRDEAVQAQLLFANAYPLAPDQWDEYLTRQENEQRAALFTNDIIQPLERLRDEYDQLLKNYPPIELVRKSGLPSDITKSYEHYGMLDLREDKNNPSERFSAVVEELHDYVHEQPYKDEVDLDVTGDTLHERIDRFVQNVVDVSRNDILHGNMPETPMRLVEEAERLEDLGDLELLPRGRKTVTVFDDDNGEYVFSLNMVNQSDAKANEFLSYGIGGVQRNDKKWYSVLKKLPIREDDGEYDLAQDLKNAMESAYDWPPEYVLNMFNELEDPEEEHERTRDVVYGDKIDTTTVEWFRLGPLYFHKQDLPPTRDEALRVKDCSSMDELKDVTPPGYTEVKIGEFLEDHPDSFVLNAERRRVRKTDETEEPLKETELLLVAPEEQPLEDYVPEDHVSGNEFFRTTILPVESYEPFNVDGELRDQPEVLA